MKSMLPIVMVVTLLSACQREEAAAPVAEPQTTATSTPMAETPAPAPAVDDTAAPAGPVSQASFLGYGDMKLGSTVDEARAAHALALAAGHRNIDAPVSGGVVGAENGTLAFMVGGADEDYTAALPLLEVMGKRIVHCGGSGLGQAAKVCNNMVLAVSQIAVAEAFVAAARRADDAGFDVVEVHAAHGYLLHPLLSPLSNRRDDRYGGDLAGRATLLLDIVRRIRAELPTVPIISTWRL